MTRALQLAGLALSVYAIALVCAGVAGAQVITPNAPASSLTQADVDAWRAAETELRRGSPGHYDDGGSKLSKVIANTERATAGTNSASAGRFRGAMTGLRSSTGTLPKLVAGRAVPVLGAFTTGWAIGSGVRAVWIEARLPDPVPEGNPGLLAVEPLENAFFRPEAVQRGFSQTEDYMMRWGENRFQWHAPNGDRNVGGPIPERKIGAAQAIGFKPGDTDVIGYAIPRRAFEFDAPKPGGRPSDFPSDASKSQDFPEPLTKPQGDEEFRKFWDSAEGEPLRKMWPWIKERAEDESTNEDGEITEQEVESSPIGTDPKVTIPAPQPGETAAAYNQRLQDLGLAGSIRQRASGDNDPSVGPDGITKVTPSPGGRVSTGTAVEVETNPSDAPAPSPGGGTDPGTTPGGGTAPQCGLTPPQARVDLSPFSRLDARGRFPLSLLPWMGAQVGGLAGDREPPEFELSVWGQSASSRDWWGLVDPIFSVLRVLFAVVLWIGVVWWLYERTLGAQAA